ncbi:dual specificity protein phosphatase family protein [Mucilaginibacter sp. KACC 22063]|uniref:dual specificity protein phosphatase family protein n=1 Tax=Mucilaginibacter sp. KACC 22063 TaxID=3025666 RepID=UPI002365548A|nr:dual specificity protein phosphatase [Mucilaginibacter sp. KACC 22063]WDF54202.1 dual specificity protein phosphatase [Mucilaginibacter sp. KACC 22063]
MIAKIKSWVLLLVIFWQKIWDNVYRFFNGLPTLKRSQITADLFLGSQYNLVGLQKLKAMGVTGIVNMRMNPIYKESQYEGFHYLHLPTVDNTPPPLDVLIKGADFMTNEIKNGGKVYVHCRQGLGRGPTMAIAYLISTGITYEDAYSQVKKVRTFINPRPGQISRLKELEHYYGNVHSL